MKVFLNFLLFAGLTFVCTYSTFAQDYPFWLNDPKQDYSEYPTAVASTPGAVATVGFYEAEFNVDDVSYSTFYSVPCFFCNQRENIFVNMREEGTSNTWTATISNSSGGFNNQVHVQSVPQVDITSKGDVYVSFTYAVDAIVEDASGNTTLISNGHNSYDFAVVKFNANGDYQWHITDGGRSDEYITDLDYNEVTGNLTIAAYIEGGNSFWLGNHHTNALSFPSILGPNFNYGNAFVAVYKDNSNNASFIWAEEVKLTSYSTDVVQDDGGNVFLSGIYRTETATVTLANIPLSGQYADGSITNNYFVVKFDPTTQTSVWAEAYGSFYQELEVAPDKRLRYSSLAIIPQTGELFFAFVSTGGGALFPDFGTYVNAINPSNGALMSSMTVGNTLTANMNSINGLNNGSPTYNPSIAVDEKGVIFITGNFLLTRDATNHTALGINFEDISIGSTSLQQSMTFAATYQSSTSVGWYTAMLDISNATVYNENLNDQYITGVFPRVFYNEVPVYGIAQDFQYSGYFYNILGFNLGKIVLDLSVNHGIVNSYDNSALNTVQFDGMILRNNAKNGQLSKRGNVTTATPSTTSNSDKDRVEAASNMTNTWRLSPNPVAAGQTLLWKSERTIEKVDYIRLVDMTGRVVQEWQQPKVTAEGFQLALDQLITGTYLLEASGKAIQQSTMVIVK